MPYKDKELGKQKKREYYQRVTKNRIYSLDEKNKLLAIERKRDLERRLTRKMIAINQHGNKCADCEQSYHPSCYDFHHLDPNEKDFNPCSGLSKKLEVFLAEVAKCVMLCANCHRIRHSKYDTSKC
ncbi:MAG TPA: hypothetical protein VFM18_01525 [Methanosarcina sp.]|nr:hypothetical protein [Methanosarcina sp.]